MTLKHLTTDHPHLTGGEKKHAKNTHSEVPHIVRSCVSMGPFAHRLSFRPFGLLSRSFQTHSGEVAHAPGTCTHAIPEPSRKLLALGPLPRLPGFGASPFPNFFNAFGHLLPHRFTPAPGGQCPIGSGRDAAPQWRRRWAVDLAAHWSRATRPRRKTVPSKGREPPAPRLPSCQIFAL